jgi:hypothetical protein
VPVTEALPIGKRHSATPLAKSLEHSLHPQFRPGVRQQPNALDEVTTNTRAAVNFVKQLTHSQG